MGTNLKKIGLMADMYFPFKDNQGNPMYRDNQKESIIKILDLFINKNKKFVCVEGPVGCGKSVINYTVSRCLGDTIYTTPQRMLLDQVDREKWDGARMIKGRSGYMCNHCGLTSDFRCSYDGDLYDTCNNSSPEYNVGTETLSIMSEKIVNIHKLHKNNQSQIQMRTSFSNDANERLNEYEEIRKHWSNVIAKFTVDSTDQAFVNEDSYLEEVERVASGLKHVVEKKVCCLMEPVECPVRSSKAFLHMSPVKLMTLDMLFNLTLLPDSPYNNQELLIIDECQSIESVVSRLFRSTIQLDLLKEYFGIDITYLFDIKNQADMLSSCINAIRDTVGPAVCAARIFRRLGSAMGVYDFVSVSQCPSKSKIFDMFYSCFMSSESCMTDEVDMIELVNYAFTGYALPKKYSHFIEFIEALREEFVNKCDKIGCNIFFDFMKESYDTVKSNVFSVGKKGVALELAEISHNMSRIYEKNMKTLSVSYLFSHKFQHIIKMCNDFIINTHHLISACGDDKPVFIVDKSLKKRGEIEDINDSRKNEPIKIIDLIPMKIGRIMQSFFYNRQNRVLLTSGTWVGIDCLINKYGIDRDSYEFIQIPSTFPKENRPVYIVDSPVYMDFSKKDEYGQYLYKTKSGIVDFNKQLSYLINLVRIKIKNQHGIINPNMVIHCFTFQISRMIAEFGYGINDQWLFQSQSDQFNILNHNSSNVVNYQPKEYIIQKMMDNPDSGLIAVSPSVSEGVDFKDGRARAQFILKCPIPYLGDTYINSHAKGNPDIGIPADSKFIPRYIFTTMIQQYGRVMRSETDWGYTIVVDQAIKRYLNAYYKSSPADKKDLNVKYFIDGIVRDRAGRFQFL